MTEWNADEYARGSSLQAAMAAEVLALARFDGHEQVLDVGCGDGRITAEIGARVPRGSATGVDPSRAMIAHATATFGSAAHPNLRFDVGDARTLAFHDAFDRVVSFNALHWVPEQEAALRSIRRAMKPGATAQLRLVPDGARASVETVAESVRRHPRWAPHFERFRDPYLHATPPQYEAMATHAGLRVTSLDVADKAWDFGTRAAFHAFCAMGMRAWTERLPETERDAFVADVVEAYLRAIGAPPGESGVFRFYQMDVALACAPPR